MKKYHTPMLFCTILLIAGLSTGSTYAETSHIEHSENIPPFVASYSLVDIGETEIDPSKLSKLSQKFTLSPVINNMGQGIGNRVKGGFIFLPSRWEYAPTVQGMTINIHSINNHGDLLVALLRGKDSVEWMVWPLKEEGYGGVRKHVHTIDPFKSDFYLTGFNDSDTIVGYQKVDGKTHPIVWTPQTGLNMLGADKGLQLNGIARAINNRGNVIGVIDEVKDRQPFFWDSESGLEALKQYRKYLEPKGWIEFADMALTDDDTVYGTFWLKHLSEGSSPNLYNPYYAYVWKPRTNEIGMIDLNGMRIADVNNAHVLVGSLKGQAAIRKPGRKPIDLAALMDPDAVQGWELIEASSINDKGQIVGYGKYQDAMHIFLANPLH